MTPHPQRAQLPPSPETPSGPVLDLDQPYGGTPAYEELSWSENQADSPPEGAGGRAVLGWALFVLALVWTGFTAWSAGRALSGEALSGPSLAQWIAVAAGPLALLGLGWLIF